jgi:hypothetical protein
MQNKIQYWASFFDRSFFYTGVFLLLCCSIFITGCSFFHPKESFFSPEDFCPSMVFFADPDGYGIRVFHPQSGNVEALTEENDDFPYYSVQRHHLYFLRRKDQVHPSSQKTNTTFHICSLDLQKGSVHYLSELTIYRPRKDRKDQLFFVEEGDKIVISPLHTNPFVLDTATGQKLPRENPWPYYSHINQYDKKLGRLFGTTNTDPYTPYFQELESVQTVLPQKTLFWWSEGSSIKTIWKSVGSESYEDWLFGFTWSSTSNSLYFSQNHTLYSWDGEKTNMITKGVHPFTIQESVTVDRPYSFPFFRLYSWIPLENENEYMFAENNHIALYQANTFHVLHNNEFLGGQTNENDEYYLFDHLVFLGKLLGPKHTYLLVSTKQNEQVTPDTIAKGNHKPDLIKIFNFHPTELDGTIDHSLFSISGSWDLHFQMEFLSTPPKSYPEIILRYTASNFDGKERMQASGRAIQWIDVYSYDAKQDMYVNANTKFPHLYKDLKEQLEAIYTLVIQSQRASNPLMCKEDIQILESKMKEARNISQSSE